MLAFMRAFERLPAQQAPCQRAIHLNLMQRQHCNAATVLCLCQQSELPPPKQVPIFASIPSDLALPASTVEQSPQRGLHLATGATSSRNSSSRTAAGARKRISSSKQQAAAAHYLASRAGSDNKCTARQTRLRTEPPPASRRMPPVGPGPPPPVCADFVEESTAPAARLSRMFVVNFCCWIEQLAFSFRCSYIKYFATQRSLP